MAYNPTPCQRKHQLYAGTALVAVGAFVFILGMIEPNGNAIVIGGIIAAVGQLMRVFSD